MEESGLLDETRPRLVPNQATTSTASGQLGKLRFEEYENASSIIGLLKGQFSA
jgi:hypothetical protein